MVNKESLKVDLINGNSLVVCKEVSSADAMVAALEYEYNTNSFKYIQSIFDLARPLSAITTQYGVVILTGHEVDKPKDEDYLVYKYWFYK